MTKQWIVALPLLMLGFGCKGAQTYEAPAESYPSQQPQPGEPPAGWEEFGQNTPQAPQEPAQPQPGATAAVERLGTMVQNIRGSTDLRHEDVVASLRGVADALDEMQGGASVAPNVARIRATADQIEGSDPTSLQHAEMTQAALRETISALDALATARNLADFGPRTRAMKEQVDLIILDQPLLKQTDAVATSLQQVVDAIALIEASPPTGTQ
ncbi:MAG: hypothetical protein Q8P41_31210 [Pseudomonadota bacterium]|nr:hypothetical protein [Pseudomonadota bacterium]